MLALATLLTLGMTVHAPAQEVAGKRAPRNLLGGSTPAFLHLAERIERGSAEEKAEFARVSLEEMGLAYSEEAQRAREAKPNPEKPYAKDPRRWASATDAYAQRLFDLSTSITMGAYAEVSVTPEGSVILSIGGRNVMVSGPHIDRPELIENRIIDRICLDPNCDAVATGGITAPGAAYTTISGRWNFADSSAPVYATTNGLNFLFEDGTNIAAKESACIAIANELNTIVQALKNLLAQNHPVDWNAVAIRQDAADNNQQVLRINHNGDFVKLALPQLALTPYVLQSALPWLRAHVEGRRTEHYVQLPPGTFH